MQTRRQCAIGYGGSILHLAFVNAGCAFVDGLYLPVHRVHTNMVASCEEWHNVCAATCAIQMDDLLPLTACTPILCYKRPYHADVYTLHMQRVQLQTNMCSCRQTASSAMDKVLSHLTTLQTHQQLRVDHLLEKKENITVCINQLATNCNDNATRQEQLADLILVVTMCKFHAN